MVFRTLALAFLVLPLVARAAAPVNDKFASATLLNGRDVTLAKQSSASATVEALDPYIGGVKLTHSVWYRFVSPHTVSAGHVIITHSAGLLRAAVFAETDPDGNAGTLSLAGQTTNPGSGTDTINFLSLAGYRYYVCVEAVGLFDITLQQPGVDNDYFADARTLSGNKGTVTGDNTFASNTNDIPDIISNSRPINGVWYKWTPTFNGQAIVDTNFSFLSGSTPHATRLYVFSGTNLHNLTLLDVDTDSGTYQNSRVSFTATSGTTYYVWAGTQLGSPGAFNLEYFQGSTPSEFEIYAPVTNLSEDQGPVVVEIRRHFVGDVSATVTVATASGTATSNSDFTGFSTPLSFPAGNGFTHDSFSQTVTILPLADAVQEADENFTLNLTPGLGSSAPTPSKTFHILDNYANVAPGFTVPAMTVVEGALLAIPIQRSSAAGEADIIVTFNADGQDTAVQNIDYYAGVSNSTKISFAPGETLKFAPVILLDNAKADGGRSFTISIDPVLSNQKVSGVSSITVNIVDDELPAPPAGRITAVLGSGTYGLAGAVDVKVVAGGVLTGKVILNRATYSFTGKLDATGRFTTHVGPAGVLGPVVTVQLLSSSNNTYKVSLGDPSTGGSNSQTVTAGSFNALNPCPSAGAYTFSDLGGGGLLQLVVGSLVVDALGNATATGKVFDGTAVVATGSADPDGNVSVGVTLYGSQGRFTLSGVLPTDLLGNSGSCRIALVRPGRANQTVELPAIDYTSTSNYLAIYVPPAPLFRVLSVWDSSGGAGKALLDGAGYGVTTTQLFTVTTGNAVVNNGIPAGSDPHLKLTLNAATGTFTGTLTPPGTTVPKPLFGALLQLGSSSQGRGFFLNPATPATSGRIKLLAQ